MPAPETTYFIGNSPAVTQAHAARTAANSISYLLPHLHRLAATTPAFRLLDVGCGPGSITLDLARIFPDAQIVGVDGSTSVIDQAVAAKHAAAHPGNCRFEVCDVLALESRAFTGFDVVLAHQLLQHVPDPRAALASLKSAARPDGGIVTTRTMDWEMMAWYPENAGLEVQRRMWITLTRALGNDALVGKKMHALAARAGWARHQIEAGADGDWCYDTPAKRDLAAAVMVARYTEDGEFAKRMRETGIAEPEGVEATLKLMRDGYKQWAEDEDGWMVMTCPWIICFNGRDP